MRRGERVRSREEGKRKDKEGELRANKERVRRPGRIESAHTT